jgi:hypothetical protein
MSSFKCKYEIDDGYVGNRPKYFSINVNELYDDMDEDDLSEYFDESMQNDFEQSVFPYGKNKEEFIKWALERIKEMEDDEE